MSAALKVLLHALQAVDGKPVNLVSQPCPCGSGVIEDDCTCQQTPPRCETCWHPQAKCECCQDCADGVCEVCEPCDEDSREVAYADSVGYSEGKQP